METAEEKAKRFVDNLVWAGLECGATMHRTIETRMVIYLKEQDRDTRHACAQAVVDLALRGTVSVNDAHLACINTRSA